MITSMTMYSERYHANMDTIHIDDVKEYIDSIRVGESCHEGSYTAQPYDGETGTILTYRL